MDCLHFLVFLAVFAFCHGRAIKDAQAPITIWVVADISHAEFASALRIKFIQFHMLADALDWECQPGHGKLLSLPDQRINSLPYIAHYITIFLRRYG
jgi:hypothetical protein